MTETSTVPVLDVDEWSVLQVIDVDVTSPCPLRRRSAAERQSVLTHSIAYWLVCEEFRVFSERNVGQKR